MNMTVHRTPASAVAAPFVLAELKDHLRIEDDASDFEIQRIARAAAAEMEQFAQVALLTQTVTLTAFDPPPDAYLRLPVGPVAQDHTPAVTMDGAAFTDFMFVAGIRPVIRVGPLDVGSPRPRFLVCSECRNIPPGSAPGRPRHFRRDPRPGDSEDQGPEAGNYDGRSPDGTQRP